MPPLFIIIIIMWGVKRRVLKTKSLHVKHFGGGESTNHIKQQAVLLFPHEPKKPFCSVRRPWSQLEGGLRVLSIADLCLTDPQTQRHLMPKNKTRPF